MTASPSPRACAWGLTALFAAAGVQHFRRPEPFDTLIPTALPGSPRDWTLWSGAAELVVAGLLAVPATRKVGSVAAQALLVGVFPGNVKMAWDWRDRSAPWVALAVGRLPLQGLLIAAARTAGRADDSEQD